MSAKPFAKVLPPKTFTATAAAIQKIINTGWMDIPPEKKFNGNAAPGDYLEHLLGGERNNRDSPDLNDWEVKFHGGTALVTLFHKEPSPRGVMKFMVHEHGWPDDHQRISFRHTFAGKSDRGFYIVNEPDRIVVRHTSKDTVVPYWLHNTILNAAGAKLRRLMLVKGQLKSAINSDGVMVKKVIYESATAYWDLKLTSLCQGLVDGKVYLDFDARTKGSSGTALRNHGTKFRINAKDMPSIYEHSRKIT